MRRAMMYDAVIQIAVIQIPTHVHAGPRPRKAVQANRADMPRPARLCPDDRHHDDVQVLDEVRGQELSDGGRAPADADVEATSGVLVLQATARSMRLRHGARA